jgi:acyl-CoA reductase-like NAD-dependent aldehyde dehydrogenase
MTQQSINPATGQAFAEYPSHTEAELQQSVASALQAYGSWRDKSFSDRAASFLRAADQLEAEADQFAILMATEGG